MTTQTITNTIITGGYTLSSSVSTLSITPTGEITGGKVGALSSHVATIINHGSIVNSSADGVELTAGGAVTNGSASITNAIIESSGVGVYISSGAATVTNFATISGGTAAVVFKSASDLLIVEAGSSLIGAVQGGGGTLELGAGVGTQSGLGTSFSGFGYYSILGGGTWTLNGKNSMGAATTLSNHGTILVGGTLAEGGDVLNGGNIAGVVGASGKAGQTALYLTGGALSKGSITAGGSLTNRTGAITGGAGGAGGAGATGVAGAYGSLTNYAVGLITGGLGGAGAVGGAGVAVALVSNNGTIIGGAGGAGASYAAAGGAGGVGAFVQQYGTLTNKGSITGGAGGAGGGAPHTGGAGGVGVYLTSHDTLVNIAVGSITGGAGGAAGGASAIAGVVLQGAATVFNYGVISGGLYSVDITSTGGVLVAEAGSVLNGAVKGGGGMLELANGAGTITGLGAKGTISGTEAATFSGFGSYQIGAKSYWALAANNTLAAGITLTVNGQASCTGTLNVSGVIAGTGSLGIYGVATIGKGAAVTVAELAINGGAATIAKGAAITVGALSLNGGTTRLNASLTNKGAFTLGAPATLTLAAKDKVVLSGASQLAGLIDGAGTVTVYNGAINAFAIGGSAVLIDAGAITGGGVSIAGGAAGKASLVIDPGASWTIASNSNFQHGAAASAIAVEGTLASNLTGHTSIESPIIDTGVIDSMAGTLELDGVLTGTGALDVESGAMLLTSSSVASTLTANLKAGTAKALTNLTLANQTSFAGAITCLGTYDDVVLDAGAAFSGTFKGFGAKDTIDLMGVVATAATINTDDQLVITNEAGGTVTPVAILQMSSQYAGEVFSVHSHKVGGAYDASITIGPGTPPQWNTETISSGHSGGVDLASKYNTLDITASGTINAGSGSYGILSSYGAAISNNGSIINGSLYGIELQSPSYVTNGSASNRTADIQSSGIGVYSRHAFVTVTNFGRIAGGSGVAVKFAFQRDRLVAEGGSTFVGAVQGGGGALELASGTGSVTGLGAIGTVSGAEAMTFSGFGSYQFDAGSSWTLSGTNTVGVGVDLTSAGNLNLTGTIAVLGTLTIAGGSATIGASGTLASLLLDGGTTYLNRSLTVTAANSFSESADAVLNLANGVSLSVQSATSLEGLIEGSGSVTMANGGSLGSLGISGGAMLVLSAGAVTENGAMSFGGGATGKASLLVGQQATWTIGYGLNLQRASESALIQVDGTIVGWCDNGTTAEKSSIACPISVTSTGTIEAQAGPLILNGQLEGSGVLDVVGGASLTLNAPVASTLKANLMAATKAQTATLVLGSYAGFAGPINCLGAYDIIDLGPQAAFTGTINGLGANDTLELDPKAASTGVIAGLGVGGTIDLLKTGANGASVNANDQLVIVEGIATVATLQLTGSYVGATFHFGADGSGGTDVTLTATGAEPPPPSIPTTTPSPHALTAAMAALGVRAGSAVAPSAPDETWRPALLGPRPQLA